MESSSVVDGVPQPSTEVLGLAFTQVSLVGQFSPAAFIVTDKGGDVSLVGLARTQDSSVGQFLLEALVSMYKECVLSLIMGEKGKNGEVALGILDGDLSSPLGIYPLVALGDSGYLRLASALC